MPTDPALSVLDSGAIAVAVGRAVADARRAAGLSVSAAQAHPAISHRVPDLAAVEAGERAPTLPELLALASVIDADPHDLLADALAALPGTARTPGTTTRLVQTVQQLHPARREHLRAVLATFA